MQLKKTIRDFKFKQLIKPSTAILMKKNTEYFCIFIHILMDYIYMLRNEAIRIAELPGLSLLQMQNRKNECPAIFITFCEETIQDSKEQREYIGFLYDKNLLFCLIDAVVIEVF